MATLRDDLIADLMTTTGYDRARAERIIDEALCSTPGPPYPLPRRRRRRGPLHRLLVRLGR